MMCDWTSINSRTYGRAAQRTVKGVWEQKGKKNPHTGHKGALFLILKTGEWAAQLAQGSP